MTTPDIIILDRKPGPAHGLSLVTVAIGTTGRAQLVMAERFANTSAEITTIQKILQTRIENQEALKDW